jgi:hypothetical protein
MLISELVKIFSDECTYKEINKLSTSKMRNRKNGIQLSDLFLYKFLYSKKDMTKERIVSFINNKNNTHFTRQAFESKENNIPLKTYKNLLKRVCCYHNRNCTDETGIKLIGIDGTYNNDSSMNEMLNMGFFDITNNIPIDIKSYGNENKNKEVSSSIDYIKENIDIFKNNIIVGDRAYFSYDFFNFLINNDIKFAIRARGEAKNLDPKNILNRNINKYETILNVKDKVRIVKYKNILQKTVYVKKKKKNIKKHILSIQNDCVLVTNLLDEEIYTDAKIMELYRSRWDIEVFFKYIKCNYKFQHIKEKSKINYKKMYTCELIITYIEKIIEKYYEKHFFIKKNKKGVTYKINKSNLTSGIFDNIIYDILNNKLTDKILKQFCNSYIKIVQNKTDRSYPRTAKTPFTKWYIKGYSNQTKYMKIINSIVNDKIDELNKNLKTLAKQIISIDGKKYN